MAMAGSTEEEEQGRRQVEGGHMSPVALAGHRPLMHGEGDYRAPIQAGSGEGEVGAASLAMPHPEGGEERTSTDRDEKARGPKDEGGEGSHATSTAASDTGEDVDKHMPTTRSCDQRAREFDEGDAIPRKRHMMCKISSSAPPETLSLRFPVKQRGEGGSGILQLDLKEAATKTIQNRPSGEEGESALGTNSTLGDLQLDLREAASTSIRNKAFEQETTVTDGEIAVGSMPSLGAEDNTMQAEWGESAPWLIVDITGAVEAVRAESDPSSASDHAPHTRVSTKQGIAMVEAIAMSLLGCSAYTCHSRWSPAAHPFEASDMERYMTAIRESQAEGAEWAEHVDAALICNFCSAIPTEEGSVECHKTRSLVINPFGEMPLTTWSQSCEELFSTGLARHATTETLDLELRRTVARSNADSRNRLVCCIQYPISAGSVIGGEQVNAQVLWDRLLAMRVGSLTDRQTGVLEVLRQMITDSQHSLLWKYNTWEALQEWASTRVQERREGIAGGNALMGVLQVILTRESTLAAFGRSGEPELTSVPSAHAAALLAHSSYVDEDILNMAEDAAEVLREMDGAFSIHSPK